MLVSVDFTALPTQNVDGLDIVTIRVQDECSVIIRAVLLADCGLAVVASSHLSRLGMEPIDDDATGCTKCKMHLRGHLARVEINVRTILFREATIVLVAGGDRVARWLERLA